MLIEEMVRKSAKTKPISISCLYAVDRMPSLPD
jgi:hypothetical protein